MPSQSYSITSCYPGLSERFLLKEKQAMKNKERITMSIKVAAILVFVILSNVFVGASLPGSGDTRLNEQWQEFSQKYNVSRFGDDGYFVRAIRHGHRLFYKTYDFAWRFTRKTAQSENNNCGSCHTPEEIAYSFASSDRFDDKLGKRVSFEERIMRCYVSKLDGFVPTIYDPAIRDIRIFARLVAHDLKITEGSLMGPLSE